MPDIICKDWNNIPSSSQVNALAIRNIAAWMQAKVNKLISETWCSERNAIDFVTGKTNLVVSWAIKGMKDFF